MKKELPQELENGRIIAGPLRSDSTYGWNGAFSVRMDTGRRLFLIISDGGGWDHVSVEVVRKERRSPMLPSWEEMCWVKDLCWSEDEWVVQFHPARKDYVNVHQNVLHLWKPQMGEMPHPPKAFV